MKKRSVVISGHSTSFSIEDAFFIELKSIAALRSISLAALIGEIDVNRPRIGLSSALRLFVLDWVKKQG